MYCKIMPIKNPNYEMKESIDELIDIVKNSSLWIFERLKDDYIQRIGLIPDKEKVFYNEEDDFIYADIHCSLMEESDFANNYEWANTYNGIDENNNILGIICIEYKRKE